MIIKLFIENIGPFTSGVELDFRINKRDKDSLESIYNLPDGNAVTKVAGIIAGNSYGKTTILSSLTSVGAFLDSPLISQKVNYGTEHIEDEDLRNYVKNIGVQMLAPINKNTNGIACIRVEMFIDNNTEYSGYYTYTLKYDEHVNTEGIIEESLIYKKRYESKKCKEILKTSKNFTSEIGHIITYKNNYLSGLTGKSLLSFNEKLGYFETFFNRYINESSIMGANNYIFGEKYIASKFPENKELLCGFMKLSDNSIVDLEVDNSDQEYPKIFVVYKNFKLRYGLISTATKKLCSIGVNFCEAYKKGGVFLIDELDNSFNRNISKFIISIYNTNLLNNTAQIIFTTNTAETVNNLRRDQIFIIEKELDKSKITKYLNFVNQESNRKSRKDWSFIKIYNENIIKNFPDSQKITELNNLIKSLK